MSMYKTLRCRYFDESGYPIKPYCSKGNGCRRVFTHPTMILRGQPNMLSLRFIHPNDRQWRGKRKSYTPPSSRDSVRKGKNKARMASPLSSQVDTFKRKQSGIVRGHDHQDSSVRKAYSKRNFESRALHVREHDAAAADHGGSLRRASDEEDDTYQYQKLNTFGKASHKRSTSGTELTGYRPDVTEKDIKPTENVSGILHHIAKLCGEVVQDTCFLDREEDKVKAFTNLSSELSTAAPSTAIALAPALAGVITSYTKTRERVEDHVGELESLWKTLFSTLEEDISKLIDSRQREAIAALHKEKESILRAITQSPSLRLVGESLSSETSTPHHPMDGWKTKMTTYSEHNIISDVAVAGNGSPGQMRHHVAFPSIPVVEPKQEGDLGASIRGVLEGMKLQMDRQTRAIELLANED
ncbi:hypothetical protein BU15DRAFT_58564 [Melanogaster broomeanus]|nr:hypothetical protein BU15DRAFT_58564 [Melanogaster broomeanus]